MLLFLFCTLISTVFSACPNGTFYLSQINKCISLESSGSLNGYFQSELACRNRGGHLMSIHSAYDNALLVTYAQTVLKASTGGLLYIGASFESNTWQWTDESAMNYTNWAPGQASIRSGCAVLNLVNSEWYSTYCGLSIPYACEVPETGHETACPAHWTQFDGSCYLFEDVYPLHYNWSTARSVCQAKKSELVSIHTAEENEFLTAFASPLSVCHVSWIGLKWDTAYSWSDTTPVTYSNGTQNLRMTVPAGFWMFPSCFPDGSSGSWNPTLLEDTAHSFICERKIQ